MKYLFVDMLIDMDLPILSASFCRDGLNFQELLQSRLEFIKEYAKKILHQCFQLFS